MSLYRFPVLFFLRVRGGQEPVDPPRCQHDPPEPRSHGIVVSFVRSESPGASYHRGLSIQTHKGLRGVGDGTFIVIHYTVPHCGGHNLCKDCLRASVLASLSHFFSDGSIRQKVEFTVEVNIAGNGTGPADLIAHARVALDECPARVLARHIGVVDAVGGSLGGHLGRDLAHGQPSVACASKQVLAR